MNARLRTGKSWNIAILACATAVYVALAVGCAMAKAPWWDEAWFANPAYNLAFHGTTGTNVLSGATLLPHIERYTYWIMPLYPVTLAFWFKLLGFGLFRTRLFSAAWGLVGMVSWFWILRKLSGKTGLATLGVVLIAFDNSWITLASEGRMDMMAAALGFAGYATYLALRTRGFTRAFLCGHALVAAAIFTHPFGGLEFVGLWVLAFALDRDRLRWRIAAAAALPYLVGALAWGAYILQDSADFLTQFAGNSAGRVPGWSRLLEAVLREGGRYVHFYTSGPLWMLMRTGPVHEWFHQYLGAIPIEYAIAILGGIAIVEIRARHDWRIMLGLAAIPVAVFSIFDWHKRYYYLVHIVPVYGALSAVIIHWLWYRWPRSRPVFAAGIGLIVALDVGGAVDQIRSNTYRSDYAPAAAYLEANATPRDTVIGPAELAFQLGFEGRLIDDQTLGIASGVRAKFIVMGSRYASALNDPTEPAAERAAMRDRLTWDREKVFDEGEYRIYRLRDATGPAR